MKETFQYLSQVLISQNITFQMKKRILDIRADWDMTSLKKVEINIEIACRILGSFKRNKKKQRDVW